MEEANPETLLKAYAAIDQTPPCRAAFDTSAADGLSTDGNATSTGADGSHFGYSVFVVVKVSDTDGLSVGVGMAMCNAHSRAA